MTETNKKREIRTSCVGIDWQAIADLFKEVGMESLDPEIHRKAFEASHTAVFMYEGPRIIGCGRAISDGQYQGAIYDIAVTPEAQGQGVGRTIMQTILNRLQNCNIVLYANPGKEDFYKKLGLRMMKTGMALFTTPQAMLKFTD